MEFWSSKSKAAVQSGVGRSNSRWSLGRADSEQLQNFSNLWEPTVDTYGRKPVPSREQEKERKNN